MVHQDVPQLRQPQQLVQGQLALPSCHVGEQVIKGVVCGRQQLRSVCKRAAVTAYKCGCRPPTGQLKGG